MTYFFELTNQAMRITITIDLAIIKRFSIKDGRDVPSISDLFEHCSSSREHRSPMYLQNRSLSVIQLSPYGKSARWSLQESIKVLPMAIASMVQSRRFTYIHKHEYHECSKFMENRIAIQNQLSNSIIKRMI